MKKPDLKHLILVACAALAVFICFLPNSVTVFTLPQENMEPVAPAYCSYFTLVEDVQWAVSLPFAAVCACVCLMFAGIYAATKKNGVLTALKWTALAGAMLAVVLVIVKNETVQMVPNMIVPIALMVEFGLAHYFTKMKIDSQENKPKNRLK